MRLLPTALLALIALVATGAAPQPAAAQTWLALPIELPASFNSLALHGRLHLNNAGQVAGSFNTAAAGSGASVQHGFFTGPQGAGVSELAGFAPGSSRVVNGINDLGQLVGQTAATAEFSSLRGFATGPAGLGLTTFDTFGAGYQASVISGINNHGQMVANAFVNLADRGAGFFVDGNSASLLLAGAPGASAARGDGINSSGQIVGTGSIVVAGDATFQALVTGADGVGIRFLGSLPGVFGAYGLALNDAGAVVGFASTRVPLGGPGISTAVFAAPGASSLTALGTLGGAQGIA